MVNPHQQSQYQKTCNSRGRSQDKGNGTDGYNCGHSVNHLLWG